MKFLLLISLIDPIFSLSKKMCINCKHFIKPNSENKIGRCSLFPILNDIETNENQYMDITNSRKIYYMCGEKGRYYEKTIPVEVPPFLSLVDPAFFDQISDFDFEQYIQFL